MISDCHMHTCFSDDSNTPVEAMAERAISLGMKRICITDHYDMDFPDGEFTLDTAAYLKKLEEVREKYSDRLDLCVGVELGLQPHLKEEISRYLNEFSFDFVIGSVHLVDGVDPDDRDEIKRTDEEMYREYFRFTLECVRNIRGFQSLGHMDYVVRYGYQKERDYSYYKYADIIDESLRELIQRDIALEMNTGGFKYGLGFPNPHPDILKRYRELGGTMVTAGSDAHRPEQVGYQFQTLKQIVSDAGFDCLTVFNGRKPEFIKI